MDSSAPPATPVQRPSNGIGALRLFFASLVIVSHSPEMLDGNLSREPLHMLFGGLSSGTLAVDAFFLISGYLIAASFAASSGLGSYFLKRVLRIYPAFIVCCLLCVFVVAPLAGAQLQVLKASDWVRLAYRLVLLKSPEVEGAFVGLPYPALNGSAWTISYEFRCYILAAVFGLIGLYRHPKVFMALTAAVVATTLAITWPGAPAFEAPSWIVATFGEPHLQARLLSAFMVGTCFWLYNKTLPLKAGFAGLAAALLFALMFIPAIAETALILLGGYALFWVAFRLDWKPLKTLNAKDDISYGVYLYAWPIGALCIWYMRDIPVPLLALLTFVGACAAGLVSWFVVEKPAMRWKPRQRARSPRIDTTTILKQGGPQPDADVRQGKA